jgi:hypothetical protein
MHSLGSFRDTPTTRVGYIRCLSVATLFCKVILPFSSKFRVKIKIPRLGSKVRDPRKTVGSTCQITDMKPSESKC